MGRSVMARLQPGSMPPRKPFDQHKLPLSVTVDRTHRLWLRENYLELGFRSESHAIDDAIGLLMQKAELERSQQQGNGGRANRSRTT
jgi:hypothetical protein